MTFLCKALSKWVWVYTVVLTSIVYDTRITFWGITFYLRVHIQSQASLVSKYQVDDGLQYGPQKGVDAKH